MSDVPRMPNEREGESSSPEGPPSPTRPPTRSESGPNMVPTSAGEPPSWIPPGDASRPDAPDPVTWATPPFRARPEPGPNWEPREPEKEPRRVSTLGVVLLSVAIVIAGAAVATAIFLSGDGDEAAPVTSPTPSQRTSGGEQESHGPTPPEVSSPNPSLEGIPTPSAEMPPMEFEPLPTVTPEDPVESTLQANPIYTVPAPVLTNCPAPMTPTTEQEWRDEVRAQWTCVHEAWVPFYEEQGMPVEMPEVNFYPGEGSKSECGYFEGPAFYCGQEGGSVYFGGAHFDMALNWDLSVNEMVNHEYGHHIQMLAGISAAWGPEAGGEADPEAVRRSELQAVCWSGMFTRANEAVTFDQSAMESWQSRLETMQESETHGTRDSLVEWGSRGLYAETLADCNTWVADVDAVR